MAASETIAALNRDTSNTLNALKPIFDKEKIEAGFEIVPEANRQAGQFLANRAKEIERAKARSEDESLSYAERAKAAQEYADLESKWGARGTHSQWGAIILGAASGNVMGGTGQFVQAAAVNYLQALGAAQIKELSKQLGGEGSVGHAALHAVLGCAGAAAQGASCGAGGAGAMASVVLSKLLKSAEGTGGKLPTAEEDLAAANLISSIVAGIAASIDPSAAAPAAVAARLEAENNSRYNYRDKVARMKAEITASAIASCRADTGCLQAEFDRADKMAAAYDVALTLNHYPGLSKEKADTLAQAVLDLAPGVSNASALYELLTGKTATGEDANKFFAAIGLVPVVGGILKKGGQSVQAFAEAGKAIDVGRVGGKASNVADSSVDSVRLSTQLAFEEAGILSRGGTELTKDSIAKSRELPIAGGRLQNPAVIKELTADGSKIEDWGKFSTQAVTLPNGQKAQIHFFMNKKTGKNNLNIDFKVKEVVR